MSVESKKFEKWFWQIYITYFNSKTHFEIYWLLLNKSRIKFINQHKYYFSFDVYAHLNIGVLSLLRIFDHDKKSINVKEFLKYCEENKSEINDEFNSCKFCNNQTIQKIFKEIKNLEPNIKALKKWRDKHIAHDEREFEPESIEWEQFNNILTFLEKYFLDYASKPNHLFAKPDDKFAKTILEIENFFDNYFK